MPQSWPSVLNSSGGAPTRARRAKRSCQSQASAPLRSIPMARSCSRPQPSPAAASWRSSSHWSHSWYATRPACSVGEGAHAGRVRPAVLRRPLPPGPPVMLGQGAERGEAAQQRALAGAEGVQVAVAADARPDPLERLPLERHHRVAVDPGLVVQRPSGALEIGQARGAAHGLGHGGDVQVEGVAVQAARRRVRARLRPAPGHVRVKGVDQERAGAARARPGRQAP